MYLRKITLNEFRNYRLLDLTLPPDGLRLVGLNASGKTSFLEAIVMLATTRSPRTLTERDLVNWASGEDYGIPPYARIDADVFTGEGDHHLEIAMECSAAPQPGAVRKRFRVDGKSVRAHDLVGIAKVVTFSPEDVELVTGPPADRRRQLDILISQIDREYLRDLSAYQRVWKQRNGLLRTFARDNVSSADRGAVTQLSFWDEELIASGSSVIARRLHFLARLGTVVEKRSPSVIDGRTISLDYLPGVPLLDAAVLASEPIQNVIQYVQAAFLDELNAVRREEFRRGSTATGPQRDDFGFRLDGRPLASFGSRGQQRLGVISLKLAEADLIFDETGERPIILLDDVLSELDDVHRHMLLGGLSQQTGQLLVTSATAEPIDHAALQGLPSAMVEGGTIRFQETSGDISHS